MLKTWSNIKVFSTIIISYLYIDNVSKLPLFKLLFAIVEKSHPIPATCAMFCLFLWSRTDRRFFYPVNAWPKQTNHEIRRQVNVKTSALQASWPNHLCTSFSACICCHYTEFIYYIISRSSNNNTTITSYEAAHIHKTVVCLLADWLDPEARPNHHKLMCLIISKYYLTYTTPMLWPSSALCIAIWYVQDISSSVFILFFL